MRLKGREKLDNKVLGKKIKELERIKKQNISKRKNLAEVEKNEMISKAIGTNRHSLLIKREELLEDLIKAIQNRAVEFSKTIEYKAYILEEAKGVLDSLDEKDIIINLKKEDKEKFQEDLLIIARDSNKNLYFDLLSIDKIGGFIITDKDKTYSLNNTFKTIINENRYKIGKELYIALEKTGELNE